MMWFTKSRRAHDEDDYETWISGGVVPTLNVFDNNSESRATILIIDGTRVNDVRVYEDGIMPTVISRYGTGGGNVPMVFPIQDGRDLEKHQNGLGVGNEGDPAYTVDTVSRQAISLGSSTVRRLTPTECERLQGFPDNWTEGQADSNRYKQMGNAVAVPVVSFIIERLVAELSE
jgi:DNA (cytosine-5)-methyltransferase 1